MNWWLAAFRQYAVFSGRARRKEFWFFSLFSMIGSILAMIFDNVLGITIAGLGYGPIYLVFYLVILLPWVGVYVRRLHDVGKSGWFLLIVLIPIIGPIWLLILMCRDSIPGENQYGLNPKE